MDNFTPVSAFASGTLAALLLFFNARMAGVSGIMNGVFNSPKVEMIWRALFISGLILGAMLFQKIEPSFFPPRQGYPLALLAAGGFLVGIGTRMGSS